MYHYFHPTEPGRWTVTTPVLDAQLQWLIGNDYKIERLRTIVDGLRNSPSTLSSHTLAITVDDGDISVYTEMFPLLKRYQVPVTLFVYPSAISTTGFVTWDQLREMVESGLVDVESHSLSHPSFRDERARRTPSEFSELLDRELTQPRKILSEKYGRDVDLLAWPHGVHDQEMRDAAFRAGYKAAFDVKHRPGLDANLLAIPRVNIAQRHRDNRLGVRLALSPQIVPTRDGWSIAS